MKKLSPLELARLKQVQDIVDEIDPDTINVCMICDNPIKTPELLCTMIRKKDNKEVMVCLDCYCENQ